MIVTERKKKGFLLISRIHVKNPPLFPNLTGLLVLSKTKDEKPRVLSPQCQNIETHQLQYLCVHTHTCVHVHMQGRTNLSCPSDDAISACNRYSTSFHSPTRQFSLKIPQWSIWDASSLSISPSTHLDNSKSPPPKPKHRTSNSTV